MKLKLRLSLPPPPKFVKIISELGNLKLLLFLTLISFLLSSKKCKDNPPTPTPTTKQVYVSLTNTWPASYPQAFTCVGSGPRIGMNPTFNQGSASFYQNTNRRFTEVKLRNIATNTITSTKLWANNNGDAGSQVIIDAPTNAAYEITFSQYDGCSNSCGQVYTSQGFKPIRLFWTKSITSVTNPSNYIYLTPQYNTYVICQ